MQSPQMGSNAGIPGSCTKKPPNPRTRKLANASAPTTTRPYPSVSSQKQQLIETRRGTRTVAYVGQALPCVGFHRHRSGTTLHDSLHTLVVT